MKIHVLGSSGFIGNQLYRYFSEDNYSVKGYSSLDCNLLSKNSIKKSLRINPKDVVIMASSITRLKGNSLESMIKNIKMADNVFNFIKDDSLSQFIFLSTIDVYGTRPKLPINENLSPNPKDYYSLSKLSSEFILKNSCANKNIPLLILRLSGVYGKKDEGKSTINKLVESANKGKITIFGDGNNRRDFVHVKNLYDVIKNAIFNKTNCILNVATGKDYSIKEITEIIKEFFPRTGIEYKEKTNGRAKDIVFDTALLKKTFPKIEFMGIKEGLDLYLREYKCF